MNMYLTISSLMACVAVVVANPHGLGLIPIHTVESIPNNDYNFNYAVNDPSTGDNKAQWETREGDYVRGAYSLVEPDGNVRLVEYTADPVRGFNAVVKRTRPNIHSISLPIVAAAPAVITAPVVEEIAEVAPVAPIAHAPTLRAPVIPSYLTASLPHAPIAPLPVNPQINTPLLAPLPPLNYLPLPLPHPAPSPYLHISGHTLGGHGNIVHRWGSTIHGGNTVTVRSRYHR